MRVKQVWDYLPLPKKAKLLWDRLTFSKLTTAYFLFSLLHCFIQLALQVRAFTINAHSAQDLFNISVQAKSFNNSVPFLDGSQLVLCPDVPTALHWNTSRCSVVWNGTAIQNNNTNDMLAIGAASSTSTSSAASASSSAAFIQSESEPASSLSSSSLSVTSHSPPTSVLSSTVSKTSGTPALKTVTLTTIALVPSQKAGKNDDDDDDIVKDGFTLDPVVHVHRRHGSNVQVVVMNLADGQTQVSVPSGEGLVVLGSNCTWALNFPVSVLDNTKREDVVFMAFQIWVLGMSIVALLNESIPHILATLLTHVLATSWAGYQISNTRNFQKDFARVITHGACSGVPQLLEAEYWTDRQDAEYASLALNVAALFISGFLSWKLFKSFGWQTFKRVGASFSINRIYKLVLVLSIVLQLSFFFMGATVALWIDSLINGVAGAHGIHVSLYKASSFVTIILLLPWVTTGYIGVRRELRLPMIAFLLLSILYLAAWSVMFLANTFRYEFWAWTFFSTLASVSVALTVLAFVLGIVCILNFGKGLLRYLNAQEPLPGDDFAPVTYGTDPEKVAFPSNHQPIPTFSATFGKGSEVPVPSQMFPAHAQMGPRFFRSSEPFDSRSVSPATLPPAYTRSSVASNETSPVYEEGAVSVIRTNTRASDHSFHSVASYYKYSDDGHSRSGSASGQLTMQGRRWAIE
ncbi:hypothetical protein D9757_006242 [Collybiopsis confluens]|uniref:Uncharacterized protein n=1 Tax=Collybiopsis confluens TaxID=2823264 RepID=A0A8H5HJJ0_9AGAR|nr:hypothetical protein D9757_006242 [Collybiopsis confluens]